MKAYVVGLRRKLSQQVVIRFETEMGRQAQVDWKEFGKQTVDGREMKLYAFVMVLGYSRKPFVRFTTPWTRRPCSPATSSPLRTSAGFRTRSSTAICGRPLGRTPKESGSPRNDSSRLRPTTDSCPGTARFAGRKPRARMYGVKVIFSSHLKQVPAIVHPMHQPFWTIRHDILVQLLSIDKMHTLKANRKK